MIFLGTDLGNKPTSWNLRSFVFEEVRFIGGKRGEEVVYSSFDDEALRFLKQVRLKQL